MITECEVLSVVKSELELHKIKLFTSQRCIDVDSKIARKAGHLRREQKAKGRKLKTPDALIITSYDASVGFSIARFRYELYSRRI